ncbi:MAG: serine/threonine protein kinase, partial [Deltaproteobacteria bacterium]|nr:serine/threonine protein kinase [Deltaproteobacteria bacterium]
MDEFAPKQFGKYYLIEKLAVGGMAEIYKAKTFGVDGFEKLLAIKRILPHCSADKEFITMLIDEAKLSVLLSHANIVQVYDLGKVGDDYFIAMEFISGINLRDVMYRSRESGEKLPPDIAVYIISEMCKGLDYAHRKTDPSGQPLGIVHRDVSPQNVLISYEGEVKIVDFGIAKAAMNISHTMAGILKGKIAYMSPEQAMGKAIDRRTDIFSTGIILHEMLTGQKLYSGESQFEVLKKIRTTKIDAGMLSSDVPQLLRPILAKALAYRPEDRYQNAGDLQVELTKFLYAMYLDFSPRKLSTCITNLFKEEIAKEIGKQGDGTIADQATSSMSLGEQDRQVEFVHREFTPPPTTNSTTARNTKSKWWVGLAAALAVMAVGGFAAFRFLPFFKAEPVAISTPLPAALPPAPTPKIQQEGVLNVISDPSGAAIMVDGKLTGFQTPATIEKLPIGQDLKVTLSKPDYEDFE